jgi:2-polyprenyl-6-methoxyphenol hydroxylase-like FAD-dependent oxidoreductase
MMADGPPRVLVIGGGLGGLCLAQGLQRHGVAVTVFERDGSVAARRQGYRLHVDSRAASGLRRCLPPELYQLFLATTSRPSRRVTVMSPDLRPIRVMDMPAPPISDPSDPAAVNTSVDRLTLREILHAGLADTVRFGARFTAYELLPDQRVRAHFADGSVADGDVLVGADGTGSAVRTQHLPRARIIDTRARCVYGRTPLASVEDIVPDPLWDGLCPVTDRRRLGLALGLVQFRERPAAAAARLAPAVRLSADEDYVMWSLSARRGVLGSDSELFALDPAGLRDLAVTQIAGWHPSLRGVIQQATPAATFALTVRSSLPVDRWPPGPVTLLGDAIHTLAPSQGSGANLAILDAARLCEALVAASAGQQSLTAAIGEYEAAMVRIGFQAVRASLKAARGDGPLRAIAGGLARLRGVLRR